MTTVRAFQELHDACRHRVYAGILAYVRNVSDAEEYTAAAFATAFEKRKSFRGDASFFTWVYRIAINHIHAGRRLNRALSLEALEGSTLKMFIQPDILDSVIDRADCCRRLRAALKRIPVMYRRVLVDHFVREYPVKQIASHHGIPVGTVLSRIYAGKRLLRNAWEA